MHTSTPPLPPRNVWQQRLSARLQSLPSPVVSALCFISGLIQVFGFAPFSLWPLGLLGLVVFIRVLMDSPKASILSRAFWFGWGSFLAGTHWIFVSIHEFGGASIFLASAIVLLFTGFLAAVFTLPFWFLARYFSTSYRLMMIALPFIWFLGEWSRTWLLTGFPWLFTGYAYSDTPLAGYAAIIGVCGMSALALATATALTHLSREPLGGRGKIAIAGFLLTLWGGGAVLQPFHWTQIEGREIRVGMIQPNLDQGTKLRWDYDSVEASLTQLKTLSEPLWARNDWIIWPEAAIPTALTFHTALPFLETVNSTAAQHQSALFTGVIYDDEKTQSYFNSIVGLGDGLGFYHKRRLVPFGEYVPLEDYLRGFIELFNLPTSYIHLGPQEQHGLIAQGVRITPAICYEIVYPDLIANAARETQILLNINNLGWFLDSLQSKQFLQMAQMRARETGRYLIYNTNNGPSALIDSRGQLIKSSHAFTEETLEGSVYPVTGMTPFMRITTNGLACFMILGLALLVFLQQRPQVSRDQSQDD